MVINATEQLVYFSTDGRNLLPLAIRLEKCEFLNSNFVPSSGLVRNQMLYKKDQLQFHDTKTSEILAVK